MLTHTKRLIGFTMLGALAVAVLQSCRSIPKGVAAVKPFDANRYLGKWYEIARFDYRFERNLNNVTAQYSFNDNGTIKVMNRGYDYKKKEWKQSTGKAKFRGESNEGKLKVSFFGPFYAGYNVIAIDPTYSYALVAGSSLKYLWLLSRQKTMPLDIKQSFLEKAKQAGYDTFALVWVEHDSVATGLQR
ncbi:MAG: lipocalin family protein [Bacteroidota bacterium]